MSQFPRPLLLGHRGAGGEAPENTWPAFELAKKAGLHGFELDVALTRDQVPAVVHDLTLKRVAGAEIAVHDLAWKDLARIEAGGHFDPRFSDERIPRLEDVLDHFGGDLILDLELKGYPWSGGVEEVVIKLVRERDLCDRVIVSSFNPLVIRKVQALAPELRTGFNYLSDSILHLRRAWFGLFGRTFSKHPQPRQATRRYIARQRRRGIWVIPWGANEPEEIRRLLREGADGLITDYPSRLKLILGQAVAS